MLTKNYFVQYECLDGSSDSFLVDDVKFYQGAEKAWDEAINEIDRRGEATTTSVVITKFYRVK